MPQKKANDAKKRRHLASFTNAQAKKKVNIAEQAARKAANDEYRERGELTPYQQRQKDRLNTL